MDKPMVATCGLIQKERPLGRPLGRIPKERPLGRIVYGSWPLQVSAPWLH